MTPTLEQKGLYEAIPEEGWIVLDWDKERSGEGRT